MCASASNGLLSIRRLTGRIASGSTLMTSFFFFFAFFLGSHLWHMEVPRLGVKSELQLLVRDSYSNAGFRATSATYPVAHSNARSLTH